MKIRFLTASILIVAFLGGTSRFVYAVSTSVSNLPPTADTYVESSKPGTNFGSSSTMWIDGNSPTRRGLLRFSLASIPAGSKITSAILRLHVASDGSATAGSLKGVSGSWVENSVTYSTAPVVGAGIAIISGPAAPNSTVS